MLAENAPSKIMGTALSPFKYGSRLFTRRQNMAITQQRTDIMAQREQRLQSQAGQDFEINKTKQQTLSGAESRRQYAQHLGFLDDERRSLQRQLEKVIRTRPRDETQKQMREQAIRDIQMRIRDLNDQIKSANDSFGQSMGI